MRVFSTILIALTISTCMAWGNQHGIFRSQSTQGPAWTGTVQIVKENYRIAVYPDYLDVELDWEFEPGGAPPEAHRDALEIVGNFSLMRGASVVGVLVWYKDMVLKGKLKTKDFARKQYEDVVDRNSPVPPRPRDPVLIEWIREDNFDISIFPVSWGGTRKLRMRYLVPGTAHGHDFPKAFTDKATYAVRAGSGLSGFALRLGSGGETPFDGAGDVALDPALYNFGNGWTTGKQHISGLVPRLLSGSLARTTAYSAYFQGHRFQGQMYNIHFRIPDGFPGDSTALPDDSLQVKVLIRNDRDSCEKVIGTWRGVPQYPENLRIYSPQPLDRTLRWRLYRNGTLLKERMETLHVAQMVEPMDYARSFGSTPFYPMARTMPASLGICLGHIDRKYALVALEEDALGAALAARYADRGVPSLEAAEIFPASDEDYAMDVDAWLAARFQSRKRLLESQYGFHDLPITLVGQAPPPPGLEVYFRNGRLEIVFDERLSPDGLPIRMAVVSIDGRQLKRWDRIEPGRGRLTWTPDKSEFPAGFVLLRVEAGNKVHSFKVHMKEVGN